MPEDKALFAFTNSCDRTVIPYYIGNNPRSVPMVEVGWHGIAHALPRNTNL